MKKLSTIICVLLVVYLLACIGEIEIKNTHANPHYSNWNFIAMEVNK